MAGVVAPPAKRARRYHPGKFFENLLSKFCFAGAVSAKKLASVQSFGVQNGTVKLKKLMLHNEMTTACLPGHILQAGNIGPVWPPLGAATGNHEVARSNLTRSCCAPPPTSTHYHAIPPGSVMSTSKALANAWGVNGHTTRHTKWFCSFRLN